MDKIISISFVCKMFCINTSIQFTWLQSQIKFTLLLCVCVCWFARNSELYLWTKFEYAGEKLILCKLKMRKLEREKWNGMLLTNCFFLRFPFENFAKKKKLKVRMESECVEGSANKKLLAGKTFRIFFE